MKIYTKKGDLGTTSIIGESNINKDHIRIEAYGTIDELNSYLGLIRAFESIELNKQRTELLMIQNSLFSIGASLASKNDQDADTTNLLNQNVQKIEKGIDGMESCLKPLKYFILPGGDVWSGYVQISRSICRRAERRIISLSIKETIAPSILVFINRLSDYLFVLGRYISKINNTEEIKWNS